MTAVPIRPLLPRRRPRRIASGFPMNRAVTARTLKWGGKGALPPGNGAFDTDHVFWSNTAYPAAGLASTLIIQQDAPAFGRNNWPQQGSFPANQSFVVDSFGFGVSSAVLVDGTLQANGATSQADADPILLAQQLQNILERTYATFFVNERPILVDQPLITMPLGAGVAIGVGLANTAASVISSVTNGVPIWANRRNIRGRFTLAANTPWRFELKQQVALPLNNAAIAGGIITLMMFGRWSRAL